MGDLRSKDGGESHPISCAVGVYLSFGELLSSEFCAIRVGCKFKLMHGSPLELPCDLSPTLICAEGDLSFLYGSR